MTDQVFEEAVDILVIGSGAGAMVAGLRAADTGANVLLVEKSRFYGGTSATSGGGLWIPCNHLMSDVGVTDTPQEAIRYTQALTGADVPQSNVSSFIVNGARMLRWLTENTHVRFQAMQYYADYYQHLDGAKPGGRSLDPLPYDAKALGKDFKNMQEPHKQVRVMGLMGYSNTEGAILLSKSPGWFALILRLAARYFLDLPWRLHSKRSRRLTMGNALIGRLRRSLLDRNVPIWLSSPASELITDEEGRVLGAKILHGGKTISVQARKGVILASGGFEHSQVLRDRYLPAPTQTRWSAANPHNTGDMLVAAQKIGAVTALMNEAWWGPTIHVAGEDRARMLFTERSMPGAIVVNQTGNRFFNESVAYTTAVQAMYESGNLPSYLIFDGRYKREYPFGPLLADGMHLNWLQSAGIRQGLLKKAASLEELAKILDIEASGLLKTVERFNEFARQGKDQDFNRGENPYDLLYGDHRISPNPCLAALQEAPYFGIEIYPGDIGTKGGLATNPNGQVMHMNGQPIPGLYAIGNCAASVTGRYYPGAGATLGPAMTFGYLAAEHACDSAEPV